MGCINSVAISGNLTRDPELRQTSGGTQVLSQAGSGRLRSAAKQRHGQPAV